MRIKSLNIPFQVFPGWKNMRVKSLTFHSRFFQVEKMKFQVFPNFPWLFFHFPWLLKNGKIPWLFPDFSRSNSHSLTFPGFSRFPGLLDTLAPKKSSPACAFINPKIFVKNWQFKTIYNKYVLKFDFPNL